MADRVHRVPPCPEFGPDAVERTVARVPPSKGTRSRDTVRDTVRTTFESGHGRRAAQTSRFAASEALDRVVSACFGLTIRFESAVSLLLRTSASAEFPG